jgi:hypothetical protein
MSLANHVVERFNLNALFFLPLPFPLAIYGSCILLFPSRYNSQEGSRDLQQDMAHLTIPHSKPRDTRRTSRLASEQASKYASHM